MLNLPHIIIDLIDPVAPCFYGATTWTKAQILLNCDRCSAYDGIAR